MDRKVIEEKLAKLPSLPGVYIMKGATGEVLYIGKAKDLKARVRSYFRETGDGRYTVRFLASKVEDIDYIVTTNEKEALLLEDTLLKSHKPRYNIRLKDSKTYVSIKITIREKFPRILVTRQRKKDGSRYFGPYISSRELRDRIAAIEAMLEKQKVVGARHVDQDVFAFVRERDSIALQGLYIREGRLTSGNDYYFHDAGLPDEEILSSFIAEYYRGERFVPDEVIVPVALEDKDVLEDWLSEKKGRRASVILPARGDKVRLLEMALANARQALRKRAEAASVKAGLLEDMKTRLHLRATPRRIEAYDISNIGGKHPVGAMVTFADGAPEKNSYRLFRIKGLGGPDDYAMMCQVLSRRFRAGEGEEEALSKPDK